MELRLSPLTFRQICLFIKSDLFFFFFFVEGSSAFWLQFSRETDQAWPVALEIDASADFILSNLTDFVVTILTSISCNIHQRATKRLCNWCDVVKHSERRKVHPLNFFTCCTSQIRPFSCHKGHLCLADTSFRWATPSQLSVPPPEVARSGFCGQF